MLKRVFTKPQNVCNRTLRFKTNLKEDCGFEKNVMVNHGTETNETEKIERKRNNSGKETKTDRTETKEMEKNGSES